MTIFALFSLLSFIICLWFGISIYYLKKGNPVNRVYALLCFFNGFWAFAEFMYRQADSPSTAAFWIATTFIWPICAVLVLHFALVFTKNKFISKKVSYIIIYGPTLFFAFSYLIQSFTVSPVLRYWGYSYVLPNSVFYYLGIFWTILVTVMALILCSNYFFKTNDKNSRIQAGLVTFGLSVPIAVTTLTGFILPNLGILIPELGNTFNIITAIFIGTAIWKYRLFNLDPSLMAENIILTMPDGLIILDQKGKILKINKALLDLTQYKQEEFLGNTIDLFYQSEIKKNQGIYKILETRDFRGQEIKIKTKSGIGKNILLSTSKIIDSKMHVIGFVCVLQDITEHKELEARLIKSERFAAIGELSGMVGHDLRNPLMSIRTAAYILNKKSDQQIDADCKKMLEKINRAIDYSDKIVNDLLDYSRDIKLEKLNTNPRFLVNEAFLLVDIPQRIQIVNKTEETPEVCADIEKLNRVFVNLIKNAIDAMPKEGVLTVSSVKTDKNVEIVFEDSGIGMSPETLSKIWVPLFTTKAKGMGFGLAICKRIVESHGGNISAKSAIGKGTVFTISLPIEG